MITLQPRKTETALVVPAPKHRMPKHRTRASTFGDRRQKRSSTRERQFRKALDG